MEDESFELTDGEKYSLYSEERSRAIGWEYTEVDKLESRQFIATISAITGSGVVVFTVGDSGYLCCVSIVAGAAALIALHVSAVLSQDAIRFYRDRLIGPAMVADPENTVVYDAKNLRVTIANHTASVMTLVSIVLLVLRCVQQSFI